MAKSSRERVLSAMADCESTFVLPSNDPLRIEEHFLAFDDGREKVAVVWMPPPLGKGLLKDGLLVVLETYPADIEALRAALKAAGTPLLARAPFLVRLSAKGLREAML